MRPCCRPIRSQRSLFSGHKRTHGIKFQVCALFDQQLSQNNNKQYNLQYVILVQSVVCPNGIIANLYGPIPGKHHDAFMLRESNLLTNLQAKFRPPHVYTLYGDPAYPLRQHMLAPYRGALVTREQELFNRRMSRVRVSVEWAFGKIVQYFAFLDFKKNLKILLQPIGKYYVVGALLTNCHTCLYGSVTTCFFHLPPPDVQTYLSN